MANFTPQEIEQFLQEFFDVVGARQYVGARYIPIFGRAGSDTVEWDDLAPYEPLTVVMHDGVSYVSRRYVPAGIDITDIDYWVQTYRFNAQVEQYRQEVLRFQDQIDGIRETMESDYVPFPDPDTYPKYGTSGQILTTLANGATKWEDPVIVTSDVAEPLIEDWLDAHPEATTTVLDGSITNAKLNANKIAAAFIYPEEPTTLITYNCSTFTITFPQGAIWHHGRAYGFQATTIDASSVQLGGAFVLYVKADRTVYPKRWDDPADNENDLLIGAGYRRHLWLNGIDPQFITIVDSSGIDVSQAMTDNNQGYLSIGTGQVVFDSVNKTITIPAGYVMFRNKVISTQGTTLSLTSAISSNACLIVINSQGTFSAVPWANGTSIKQGTANVALVGLIFRNNVWINGVPQNLIKVLGTDLQPNQINGLTNKRFAYVGTRGDRTVTYDAETYVLTIPDGFWYINGSGMGHGVVTLDASQEQTANAFVIVVDSNLNVSAIGWSRSQTIDANLYILGYVYRDQVILNGIRESQIQVINARDSHKIYCFGDSITAGVGADVLYHMLWNQWDNINRFKNYGIGSTGYCVEATGTVQAGKGVEGDGSASEETGDNTILEVMQSVQGSMYAITISAGTNDWSHNIPATTFRSAVAAALDYALTKTARVFVMTPLRRENNDSTNTEGLRVSDYADIINEECVARGIPCSDGYGVAINPNNAASKNAYMPDGLHPNNAGQVRLARHHYQLLKEALGE